MAAMFGNSDIDFFKKSISKFFFIGIFLMVIICLQAQQKFLPKAYTAKDGLPNGYVLHINQDHEGNLWIGTFSGLSRFDGNSFLNYGFQKGLTNLSIDEVYEEEDSGRLWLGSRNGIFVLSGDTIKQVAVEDSVTISFVFQIQKISTGQIWALTDKGIYVLDNEYRLKKIKIPGMEEKIFRQVIETDNKHILVTHETEQSEVFSIDSKMEVMRVFPTIPNNGFIDIISFSEQEMIIRTEQGLLRVNKDESTKLFAKELDGKSIYACLYDRHGRLWISTNVDGILIADSISAKGFSKKIEVDEPVKMISSFYESADGTIWAGTSNSLLQINSINYRIYKQADNPLIETVFKILKDKNGKLFLDSKSGLLSWVENSINPVAIESKYKNQNNLKGALIDSWSYDGDNNLWYMSRGGVFNRVINGSMEEVSRKRDDELLHVRFEFDFNRNKMWIPANELLLGDAQTVSVFQPANNKIILSPTLVTILLDGDVLVKTSDNKLWKIDSKDQANAITTPNDIDVSRIQDFQKDNLGDLWLLYLDGGLLKCTIQNNQLVKQLEVSMKSGMPSNAIESFTFDNENRIWIATHAGLSLVNWKSIESDGFPLICQMDKVFNLPIQNWAFANLLTDNDGNIRLTLVNQAIIFFVKEIVFNNKAPSTKIEKILLDSEANIYDSHNNVEWPITLNHDRNFLTFYFKGISLIDHSLLFSYKLVGATELWSNPSPNNIVSYGKLSSGDYEFLVKTRTASSFWSEPASFRFTITKPFWAEWYFILMITLVLILLVYWVHKIRLRQALRIERMRLRIAQDLHDEIGSTLSSVSYTIDSIQRRLNGSEVGVKKLLETITATSATAIRTLNDIVWAINPEKDDSVSLGKRMNQFALELCQAREIQFTYDEGSDFKNARLSVDVRKSFYLIFKEAINNAVKHSNCTEIKVRLLSTPNAVELVISDNGKGFEKTWETEGNGLKNINERSKEIHGQLMITSKLGRGTVINLKCSI